MSKKIIIVGSGVAGPLLGMLLKHKGFNPVVYEKHSGVQKAGLVFEIAPKTFRVLSVLKLDKPLLDMNHALFGMRMHSQLSQPPPYIGPPGLFSFHDKYPMVTIIERWKYCQFLADKAKDMGVPIVYGKEVKGVHEVPGKVAVEFTDGGYDEGELVAACDGLHSPIRRAVWGQEKSKYTGVIQIGGIAPTPDALEESLKVIHHHAGNDAFLSHAPTSFSKDKTCWALTIPQAIECYEDWKRLTGPELDRIIRNLPVTEWGHGVGDLVKGSEFVTRFGHYQRAILKTWGKGRVVLVGDAAHPVSPLLRTGVNQAAEDAYELTRILSDLPSLSTKHLKAAYNEYAPLRISTIVPAVEHNQKEWDIRTMTGAQRCKIREKAVGTFTSSKTPEDLERMFDLVSGPFEGDESEL